MAEHDFKSLILPSPPLEVCAVLGLNCVVPLWFNTLSTELHRCHPRETTQERFSVSACCTLRLCPPYLAKYGHNFEFDMTALERGSDIISTKGEQT